MITYFILVLECILNYSSMDVSHSVYSYISDTRSVFWLNRIKLFEITNFCQVIYFDFLMSEEKCLSQQQVGIMLENVILNEIIYLLYLFLI